MRPVVGGLTSDSRDEAVAGGMTLRAVPVGGAEVFLAAYLARKLPPPPPPILGPAANAGLVLLMRDGLVATEEGT